MGLGTDLASLLSGFQEGDANLLKALELAEKKKEKEQKLFQKLVEEEEKVEKERIKKLKEETSNIRAQGKIKSKQKRATEKDYNFWQKGLAKFGYESDAVKSLKKEEEQYLETEESLLNELLGDNQTSPLGSLSEQDKGVEAIEESATPKFDTQKKKPSLLSRIKEKAKSHPSYEKRDAKLKEILYRTEHYTPENRWEDAKTVAHTLTGGDVLRSIPSSTIELLEGGAGLAGKEDLKEKIREDKLAFENIIGVRDRNSAEAKTGRIIGDIIDPIGKVTKVAKGLPLIKRLAQASSKLPKSIRFMGNLAKNTAKAGTYGAIQSEINDEDPVKGALVAGGVGAGLNLAFTGAPKLAKKMYQKTAKGARYKNPEEIISREKLMGEKALIPMRGVEENIERESRKFAQSLPTEKEEIIPLYQNIENLFQEASEQGGKLYDTTKEMGVGKEAILPKGTIKRWINAIRRVDTDVKGLNKLKGNGGKIDNIEHLLMFAPENPNEYEKFVRENYKELPLADDFLRFLSDINERIEGKPSDISYLKALRRDLNEIVSQSDPEGTLKKAKKFWRLNVVPLDQKPFQEARTSGVFKESEKGRPKVSTVFSKQSGDNSMAFEKLSTQDKKRVLGAFVKENSGKEKLHTRAISDAYEKLPDYIKETNDPVIRKLVKDMESINNTTKTLSSLQQATTESIGSRPAIPGWLRHGGPLLGNILHPDSNTCNSNFRILWWKSNIQRYKKTGIQP